MNGWVGVGWQLMEGRWMDGWVVDGGLWVDDGWMMGEEMDGYMGWWVMS